MNLDASFQLLSVFTISIRLIIRVLSEDLRNSSVKSNLNSIKM